MYCFAITENKNIFLHVFIFISTEQDDYSTDEEFVDNVEIPVLLDGTSCAYSLCFDNVNQKTTARHSSSTSQNVILNMVQGYAARDRIPTLHLSSEDPSPEFVASISAHTLLPSPSDTEELCTEYKQVISIILTENMPLFRGTERVDEEHEYAKESRAKSDLVIFDCFVKILQLHTVHALEKYKLNGVKKTKTGESTNCFRNTCLQVFLFNPIRSHSECCHTTKQRLLRWSVYCRITTNTSQTSTDSHSSYQSGRTG